MSLQGKLRFVSDRNPIHRVNPDVYAKLIRAQETAVGRAFSNAAEICDKVFDDLKLKLKSPDALANSPVSYLVDRTFSDLCAFFLHFLNEQGVAGEAAQLHAQNISLRLQLTRAFENPDQTMSRVTTKVQEIIVTFPKTAADIERGRNPGDVLDPYILAATQTLLHQGDFQAAMESTVAHKALMIIEGLLGHLHEEVIGEMRGNIRAPEPRGFNQEILDLHTNPFPGADVVQPPFVEGGQIRVHQVKSKTGSAKGGDGKRLGDQLNRLREYYAADIFYDALIGTTLRGHRSMNGVIRAAPQVTVLVGSAAFRELTGSAIGAELLLRVYQSAFTEAARQSGYQIEMMVAGIVETFRDRAETIGSGFLELLLRDATAGDLQQQDSRVFLTGTRRRR